MTILIASLSLFLGLSQKSTMIDITNKFGSPISVTNDEKENLIDFQYNRDGYTLDVYCAEKSKINRIEASGVNSYVNYRGVRLGDNFAKIIKNIGNLSSYNINP